MEPCKYWHNICKYYINSFIYFTSLSLAYPVGRCGRQDSSPSLWMWRQDSDSPPKLYSWPLPFLLWESTALHSNYRNTQQKNPRNWVTAAMLLSLGFKGWWNTQRKTLWSNLAKGGKAPTAWQDLMSESTDPITCPSIATNPGWLQLWWEAAV